MKGNLFEPWASTEVYEDQMPSTQAPVATGNNMQDNTQYAISPGSVYWLFLMTVVYVAWGYWQNSETVKGSLKYENIKFNLHNIVGITLSVVIGVNMMNVLLTKLSGMRIPFVSKTAGTFLPLFHL